MEHLVDPEERALQRTNMRSVPWLGFDHDSTKKYPLVDIKQYPLIRGWTEQQIRQLADGDLGTRDPVAVLSMIQGWMFLGLLESFFEAKFEISEFIIYNDAGSLVVDTSYLRDFIDAYHLSSQERSLNASELRQRRQRLVDILREAEFWNMRLDDLSNQSEGPKPFIGVELFHPVVRLITLTAEALWAAAMQFPSLGDRFFIPSVWRISIGNETEFRSRLKSRGWCPSRYNYIKNLLRTPSSFLEYVILVPPFEKNRNGHRSCSSEGCIEYNIDERSYKTKHTNEGKCNCKMISPTLEGVKSALLQWTIPLVDGERLLSHDIDATVPAYSYNNNLGFVAFSRVWSDGLGSSTENGLPECQIKHLSDISQQVAGTSLFWIDSLCIPKDYPTRKLAISMMAETYKAASATVVLDSGIKNCERSMPIETKIVALTLSMWQQRLWTLQESSLSKKIFFQFKDDLIKSDEILDITSMSLHQPIVQSGHLLLDNLTGWVHDSLVTVGGMQRNVYCRTSSKPDDESLAVAPFFNNVDISKLLSVEGENRMMSFWTMVKNVPKAIILHNGPKISRDGFRWAPRSIMGQSNAMIMDFQDRSATVTVDGLKGEFFVYSFSISSSVSLKERNVFYDSDSDCCLAFSGELSTQNNDGLPSQAGNGLSISSDYVIALIKQLDSSIFDEGIGVVLSSVPTSRTSFHRTSVFRYEGHVGVATMPRNLLWPEPRVPRNGSTITPDVAWSNLVNQLSITAMITRGQSMEITIQ